MRRDWDRRARENARYYVATDRSNWTDEEFFASGEKELADTVLNDMDNICQGRDPASMRVLEIGCGAGRVTRALAGVFGEVHAVDVSGEMIAQARSALAGLPNVFLYQNNGMDLAVVPNAPFDFAFSVIVFQHIPSFAVIESYFREAARLLRPGALFKLQVHGLPEIPEQEPPPLPVPPPEAVPLSEVPWRWRLAGKIPLPIRRRFLRPIRQLVLPPSVRTKPRFDPPDTWVGVMVTPEDAQSICDRCGFELRHQRGAGGQEYWLWCFRK